jgi:glucose-6-phosphate 1-dehydrogenase
MPHTMVVFGITGDLMRLKGLPALFALWKREELPPEFRIVGLSRKKWSDEEFRAYVVDVLEKNGEPKEEANSFAKIISMVEGEAGVPHGYDALKVAVGSERNLLLYLCVSPDFFTPIIAELGADGFLSEARILIEKPFGVDLTSAHTLQELLLRYTKEERIYRIDHFLAKEAMHALSTCNLESVASIEVYLNESLGVEKRGALYDPVGALRDVGQNHLLEAAAAVLGDRAAALERLHDLTAKEIKSHTKRGQHEGYKEIVGVAPHSQTETYFRIETWFNVGNRKIPLVLESGKRLPSRREVVVTLIDGEKVIPFESGPNEYEILFKEALMGDRSRFVSMREVEALWRFTDPIEKEWRANAVPLLSYKPDTNEILKD